MKVYLYSNILTHVYQSKKGCKQSAMFYPEAEMIESELIIKKDKVTLKVSKTGRNKIAKRETKEEEKDERKNDNS